MGCFEDLMDFREQMDIIRKTPLQKGETRGHKGTACPSEREFNKADAK
jgi:hypothetical protein